MSGWNHSFTRLFTLLRAALWSKVDLSAQDKTVAHRG
jgi:hypothetical protein